MCCAMVPVGASITIVFAVPAWCVPVTRYCLVSMVRQHCTGIFARTLDHVPCLRYICGMAWKQSTTTRHTCGGPAFGRKTPGCPRCDELTAGAAPVAWRNTSKQDDMQRCAGIHAHFAGERHRSGGCGPVCTFGEW